MTTRVHATVKPLPVVLPSVPDEVLSSWIGRHAVLYGVSPIRMLRHCLPSGRSHQALDHTLTHEESVQLAFVFHRRASEIRRMTHADLSNFVKRRLISHEPTQICRTCRTRRNPGVSGAVMRGSLQGWRVTCPTCGSRLLPPDSSDRQIELFAKHWPAAVEGERLLDNYIVRGIWTWISPLALLRLLLVRRACTAADFARGVEKGRVVEVLVPAFDETVQQHQVALPKGERLIIPLGARVALLAAVALVEEEGRAAIRRLRGATLGNYRFGFDTILAESGAENRRRDIVSQLLQT